jgi:hypothetical protein
MFAPGDGEVIGTAAEYRRGFGSPELSALADALTRLVGISESVADSVTRHDRVSLLVANEQAESLVDEVNGLAAGLSSADRVELPEYGIPALCERLAAGARRNAYLIEQAWAVDAALMRLLLGLGKVASDGTVGGYSASPGPTYVDRQA